MSCQTFSGLSPHLGLRRAVKRLDDLHPAATARADAEVFCGVGWITVAAVVGCSAGGWRVEECSTAVQHVGTVTVCKQTIVPNAVEAVRQGVHQKASDELTGLERHHFALAALAIILPAKADLPAGQRDQPAIGDCSAMGVTRKIGEYLLGADEWTLGKDHPFASTQGREILLKRRSDFERHEIGEELKFAGSECRVEILQKQPLEQARQHPNGQEEV